MLRTSDPSFGAFNYEEKCYRCGYKFTLNVSFDQKGIRNFCVLEGKKFEVERRRLRKERVVVCPNCRRSLKMKKVVKAIKHT